MKKEFKFAFVLMLLLLLVGCGAKEEEKDSEKGNKKEAVKDGIRVVCSMSKEIDGMNMSQVMSVDYKKSDNSVSNVGLTFGYDYSKSIKDATDKEKEEVVDTMDAMLKGLNDSFAEEYGSSACEGKNENANMSFSCKLSPEQLKEVDADESEEIADKDTFIKESEDKGFTCKTEEISLEK